MRDTFLFDLDGTLLPMDFKKFMEYYFHSIGQFFKEDIEPVELMKKINETTKHTVLTNDGRTNEAIFVERFNEITNVNHNFDMDGFYQYYNSEFILCKNATWQDEYMMKSIELLKEKGYHIAIATNPLLPLISNHHRIKWAGLNPEDFCYISSFEGNRYCKPFLDFYEEVLTNVKKSPEQCYMVGNDVTEDMIAGKLGIETYLINDCIINDKNLPIISNHQGSYKDFYQFVTKLKTLN